ncbi:MAG: hypothetical protein JNG90_17445 [Planctomycetaceae bacterium]|nr:hypothetical protein [Planctomycetaceae bacterium]
MKQDLTGLPPSALPPPAARRRSLTVDAVRIAAPLAIVIGGVIGFATLSSLRATPEAEARPPATPLVETVVVAPHSGGVRFSVDGLVVPYREIDLSAEVAGRIAKKHEACRAGTFVTRGTPLFEIDARDYELEVRRLQRELRQAEVALDELDVEVQNADGLVALAREQLALQRKELERVESLAGKGFSTTSELDKTKRDELTGLNAVLTLENQMSLLKTRRNRLESARDLAQSQLEKAQLDLERTKVVAPLDGVVVQELGEEDSYVQKGASLLKLEDTSAVEVRCHLRMDQLLWLWAQETGAGPEEIAAVRQRRDYQIPRAPVVVSYELSGRHYEWDGVVSRFDGIGVDERTRTVPCRVLVAKPREVRLAGAAGEAATSAIGPPALVRGMYVTISVQTSESAKLLELPESALRPGNRVWEVVDGRLVIRDVRVAHSSSDVVLVHADSSALQPGARVISSPLAQVVDGMAVQETSAP